MRARGLLMAFLLCFAPTGFAIDTFRFDTPQQEQRFQRLAAELRCLVCQNQSLADSNAELALDLRRQVHHMIVAGKTDAEIVEYMVARYGDFVLYRPPVRPGTWLLWFGPLLLLAAGAAGLAVFVRRRAAQKAAGAELTPEERRRLEALMEREQQR